MEKLGHRFFSVKNIGSQLEINKILLGGYNSLLSLCSMTTPMQIINDTLNGGCIMITLQFRGGHTIFDYQIRGSQNIAEVPLEIYEPLFQSTVTS